LFNRTAGSFSKVTLLRPTPQAAVWNRLYNAPPRKRRRPNVVAHEARLCHHRAAWRGRSSVATGQRQCFRAEGIGLGRFGRLGTYGARDLVRDCSLKPVRVSKSRGGQRQGVQWRKRVRLIRCFTTVAGAVGRARGNLAKFQSDSEAARRAILRAQADQPTTPLNRRLPPPPL